MTDSTGLGEKMTLNPRSRSHGAGFLNQQLYRSLVEVTIGWNGIYHIGLVAGVPELILDRHESKIIAHSVPAWLLGDGMPQFVVFAYTCSRHRYI